MANHQTLAGLTWLASLAGCLSLGLTGACSGDTESPGTQPANTAGATAGMGAAANGGHASAGAAGKVSAAGTTSVIGGGGTSAGGAGAGGAGAGGSAGSGSAGSGGGSSGGDAGASGIVGTSCELESLHFKVSGGATFERNTPPEDTCGAGIGGDDNQLVLSFFLNPPELEGTVLASTIAYSIPPGTTGTFMPEDLSILVTGAIWSRYLPDSANPLPCSLTLTKYELVSGGTWRVAGSLSCSGALSGIGPIGSTPLTLEDWTFSLLVDTGAAMP